jgi:carboxylesterase
LEDEREYAIVSLEAGLNLKSCLLKYSRLVYHLNIIYMVKRLIKSVRNILFFDPQLLYKEEKELLNKPFYFEGNNGKAVLLIHGWSSTSYEVRRLGLYLNENGYTVSAPMLRGHGTVPKDLECVKWTDWLSDLEEEYDKLRSKYQKVYVAGTSIGANLAIMLAADKKDISGLMLMATPYNIKMEKIIWIFMKSMNLFKTYNKKFYPPTFGLATSITRLISYQSYPIKSAMEAHELIKKCRLMLPKVEQPCLLLQSASDHIVGKRSMENIYNRISSPIKEKKYIQRAYHTFISDIKNSHVFEDILGFLEEN